MKKFPRYFVVDGDIPVKIDLDEENQQVFGENSLGNPYSPFKALSEGKEITQEEFKRLSKALSASS